MKVAHFRVKSGPAGQFRAINCAANYKLCSTPKYPILLPGDLTAKIPLLSASSSPLLTTYAQLAQYDQAEADFRKAEQLDSAQSLSAYGIDLAEIAKNNLDKALLEVRSQLKAHPESSQLHFMLAKIAFRAKNGNGQCCLR